MLIALVLGCGSSSSSSPPGDAAPIDAVASTGGQVGTGGQSGTGVGGTGGSTSDAALQPGTGGVGGLAGSDAASPDAIGPDASLPADGSASIDGAQPIPDAGSGGDVGSSAARASCMRGCDTTVSLHCPKAATCLVDCVSEFEDLAASKPQCRSALEALLTCAAARPAADWQCGSDGKEELKPGVCEPEGLAAINCVLGS
ncbi:MAG TPA: hypothetical protein VN914_07205 [Polyangia bacterium]|nr:hypothetical protein [Polyangia bacterium]